MREGRLWRFARSVTAKLLLLLVVFLMVPWMIFVQFRAADEEKRVLLLKAVQEQGRLIASGLRSTFRDMDIDALPALNDVLAGFGVGDLRIKVFFGPAGNGESQGFFYVAAWPVVPNEYLDSEREHLAATGILEKMRDTCEGQRSLATQYLNPAGHEELLTSLTPVRSTAGCWVVITSHPAARFLGADHPVAAYWQSPELRIAASVYLGMAVLVITQFLGIWRNLRGFALLARRIGAKGRGPASFRALNRIPELDEVAAEFDRLVANLRKSADDIRLAAEEKAHTLKTPIAVITQAIEPLRRSMRSDDVKGRRALQLIEKSAVRLDALVSAARESEEATAELIDASPQPVELGRFLRRVVDGYAMLVADDRLALNVPARDSVIALADEDLLATVMENVIDNALGFVPPKGRVVIALRRRVREAEIAVEDEGPGVPPDRLEAIFERYYSHRPAKIGGKGPPSPHFGLGLWIARRNVEALGGTVKAQNREPHGLRIVIRLALAG